MATWADLKQGLDAWSQTARCATLWWRDDDAVRVTPALERLLALSEAWEVPVSLAVIPADADDGLRDRLSRQPLASVLQHGWRHANHAPSGPEEEFGPHRPLQTMLEEVSRGWTRIAGFARGIPVFVSPWNRIDPLFLPHLPKLGLRAVSTLGPRASAYPCAGLSQTNVHVDVMEWRGSRGFVGLFAALEQVITHLRQRRLGEVDADEPTGLMTHHSFHDEDCWRFLDSFLSHTRSHPAVRWLDGANVFRP